MLSRDNMSSMRRYAALTRQVLRLRDERPIRLRIMGEDFLESVHHDLMLEAATTSLQVHLKVPQSTSRRYYNASLIASAFTVALAANAPLLFGKRLWDDTRIPVFEQAVDSHSGLERLEHAAADAELKNRTDDFDAVLCTPNLRLQGVDHDVVNAATARITDQEASASAEPRIATLSIFRFVGQCASVDRDPSGVSLQTYIDF